MAAMQQTSSDTNCECEKRFTSQVSSCQPRLKTTSNKKTHTPTACHMCMHRIAFIFCVACLVVHPRRSMLAAATW